MLILKNVIFFFTEKWRGIFSTFDRSKNENFGNLTKDFSYVLIIFSFVGDLLDFFSGRWASQKLCKSLAFPGFPRRTITLSKKEGGVLEFLWPVGFAEFM